MAVSFAPRLTNTFASTGEVIKGLARENDEIGSDEIGSTCILNLSAGSCPEDTRKRSAKARKRSPRMIGRSFHTA